MKKNNSFLWRNGKGMRIENNAFEAKQNRRYEICGENFYPLNI